MFACPSSLSPPPSLLSLSHVVSLLPSLLQVEGADVLVLNKCDLITPEQVCACVCVCNARACCVCSS